MNDKPVFLMGFVLGAFLMGLLTFWLVTKEVSQKRDECELNIPRNQNCVMQFVPEVKK